MKPYLYTLLAAAAATGLAQAQTAYTTPVGYVTENLITGFNLVGLSVHEPTLAAGAFTGATVSSVADANADFTVSLTGAPAYILEITSGAAAGVIQVVNSFTATEITTTDDLVAAGVQVGDTYNLRACATVSSVFGANNESGLQASSTAAGADVIWVPNGTGGYDQYYRNAGVVIPPNTVIVPPSWQTLGGQPAADALLVYTDGMFIERKGAPIDLVISGEVKTTPTSVVLPTGFSIVGPGFGAGLTLDSSNLAASLQSATTAAGADVVWNPNGAGGYDQYYYNAGVVIPPSTVLVPPSWQTLGGASAGSTELKSGFFIERKGAPTNSNIAVPY